MHNYSKRWVTKNIDRTMSFLTINKLAYVCVDEPQGFNSSVPPVIVATTDISVIRVYGRNKVAWERENTASGRFNYQYNENELKEWHPDCVSYSLQLQNATNL